MTTERAPKHTPRVGLTGLEWKLLLTAALGATYTAAWAGLVGPTPAPTPATAGPRRAETATIARAEAPRRRARVRTRSS